MSKRGKVNKRVREQFMMVDPDLPGFMVTHETYLNQDRFSMPDGITRQAFILRPWSHTPIKMRFATTRTSVPEWVFWTTIAICGGLIDSGDAKRVNELRRHFKGSDDSDASTRVS